MSDGHTDARRCSARALNSALVEARESPLEIRLTRRQCEDLLAICAAWNRDRAARPVTMRGGAVLVEITPEDALTRMLARMRGLVCAK